MENLITHSQELAPGVKRDNQSMMGGDGSMDPIYDMPNTQERFKI